MPVLAVTGAKGGCGASLVATNLALALAPYGATLLVDLHVGDSGDDLLLDLLSERTWADLLPVAAELTARHLDLVLQQHSGGLHFLAGPAKPAVTHPNLVAALMVAISSRFEWTVLDLPGRPPRDVEPLMILADSILVVATADPPALRAAQRLLEAMDPAARPRARLVLNQFTRAHPAHPASIAAGLQVSLLATLPTDPRAVGFHVNFGRPCVLDRHSAFGRRLAGAARALAAGPRAGRVAA